MTPCLYLVAQEYDEVKIEEILEKVAQEQEISPLIDLIEGLNQNPIDLSKTNIEELSQIPGISIHLSKLILDFVKRNKNADYVTISDSLALSEDQLFLLKYCTIIGDRISSQRKRTKNLYLRLRQYNQFNKPKGLIDGNFQGNELDLYQRYSLYYDDYAANILINKDLGEKSIADFYSGNISGKIFNTKIILGDFNIQSGMGSILWQSYSMGKGMDVISPALQYSNKIEPYRSSLEYNFFRGAAIQSNIQISKSNNINILAWYSDVKRAATIDTASNIVTSLYQSSYFRTNTEIRKKNTLKENTIGGSIEWAYSNFTIGFNGFKLLYNYPIESSSKRAFLGESGFLSSVFATFITGSNTFGGELSKDAAGNMAFKVGYLFEKQKYSLSMHFRNYSSEFRSPFGFSFGESSIPSNEVGLYLGFSYRPYALISINNYLDVYQTHSRTYYVPFKVAGYDLFSETDWLISKKTKFIFRFKFEDKTDIISVEDLRPVVSKKNYSTRFELQNNISSKFQLRIRAEAKAVSFEKHKEAEFGIMSFVDLSWKPFKFLSLNARLTYFSTDSYESAIWQYEGGIAGYMLSNALYGSGARFLLYSKVNIFNNLNLWIKYSNTQKNNVDNLSSGYTLIEGNSDNRLILQLDLSF